MSDDGATENAGTAAYVLDAQIGFLLRKAHQRHVALFTARIGDRLTPTQWAALARLAESGPMSQNRLGRDTAMDVATIKGVVDRLVARGLVASRPDPSDGRRVLLSLTEDGEAAFQRNVGLAQQVTRETLAPLGAADGRRLAELLRKLA